MRHFETRETEVPPLYRFRLDTKQRTPQPISERSTTLHSCSYNRAFRISPVFAYAS